MKDTNIARTFIKKHHKSIICEPSGLTLEELRNNQIQMIQLIPQNQYDLPKKTTNPPKNKEMG